MAQSASGSRSALALRVRTRTAPPAYNGPPSWARRVNRCGPNDYPTIRCRILAPTVLGVSFEYSHAATYYLALAQLHTRPAAPYRVRASSGVGQQHGDQEPYGDNGSGTVAAAGVALRVPSGSIFGLTLTADLVKSMTGTVTRASGQAGSSYRPLLLTIGLGLNIAGQSSTPASAR